MPLATTDLAQALLSYLPPAVARAVRACATVWSEPTTSTFPAAVLFSDVSGFTVLTSKLAERGAAGAEELTALLNRYFSRMIEVLEQQGGEVVQFSGDAVMVVFPCPTEAQLPEAVRCAWQAGTQMQAAMKQEFAKLATSVGEVELGMKVSIGAGQVQEFHLGGQLNRWYYLIAGHPLYQVGEAEHHAERGQVVLSPEAQALLSDRPVQAQPLTQLHWPDASPDTLARLGSHVPYIINHRLSAGQADWLAEIRRLTVVFFNIQGLDYGTDAALEQAQRWMLTLQEVVYHYEGSLNKLLVDDKGTIGIALFGAPPLSHEDDPWRAVRCALDLRAAATAQGLTMSIGLTTGRVFAGPVGSLSRREYTVMGDAVNLAARLMQSAAKAGGGIRSDFDTHQATANDLTWETLPPEKMKGILALVRVYQPVSAQRPPRADRNRDHAHTRLIGRDTELAQLATVVKHVLAGQSQAVMLESDPGMGRNSLLNELINGLRERNVVSLLNRADALEQQTPYSAWREIFRSYFDIENAEGETRRAQVLERLTDIAPQLLERAPLLNDLLNLGLPENDLTAHLEPRLRQASLASLLLDLLARWAAERPLVLALEESQWLDSLSWQMALQVARGFRDMPVLLVITLQTLTDLADDHPYSQLIRLPYTHHLRLKPLDDESIGRVAAARLGVSELPVEATKLIVLRAAGNPFVAEEIGTALQASGILRVVDGDCELVGYLNEARVPDTVHGLVLNRIDRLDAEAQLALKVAAVIGRTFGYRTLHAVYPAPVAEPQLHAILDSLSMTGMVRRLDSDEQLYSHSFGQTIFQEVTYGTLLQAQSRDLHARVAQWYEAYATRIGEPTGFYPLLAYHWRQADQPSRELYYAARAGKELAAEYANNEALSFLDRALQLEADPAKRYELLNLRQDVLERLGNRAAQQANLEQLQTLVDAQADPKRQAQLANAWAEYYRKLAEYPAALAALGRARHYAQQAQDSSAEARTLTLWGQVLEHHSQFPEARDYFEQALTLYRRLDYKRGEANNLSRLSSVARSLGEKAKARDYELEALQLRRGMGDRASEATSLTNLSLISNDLGETEAANHYRQQALALTRAIGDRAGEALNLGNIGMGYFFRGDYAGAQRYLHQALRLHQAMGNRLREAECQNILGAVWRDVGDTTQAQTYFEQAVATQEAIGNRSYATYTYLNLGYVLLDTDPALARQHFATAWRYARETGNREAESYALSYLAYWHEHAGDWEAARAHYQEALPIRQELQAQAAAIEDTAGLARVTLAQHQLATAHAYATLCWEHLQTKGVDGMEFPVLVYLTCYDVFSASHAMDVAHQAIEAAHQLLQTRVAPISDLALREGMLHNVASNRRVMDAWRTLTPQS